MLRDATMRLRAGRTLAWSEWGAEDGLPILFFHGTTHSRLFCPDEQATVVRSVRLVCPDRPGVGGSDPHLGGTIPDAVSDVQELADELGLGQFAVAGWSGGAMYAMGCGALLPDRVTAVALISGFGGHVDEDFAQEASLGDDERRLLADVRSLGAAKAARRALAEPWIPPRWMQPFAAVLARGGVSPGDVWIADDEQCVAAWDAARHEAFKQGPVGVVGDYVAAFAPWGFALSDVGQNVYLFHAAQDALVTDDDLQFTVNRVGRPHVTSWPDVGHFGLAKYWGDVLDALSQA